MKVTFYGIGGIYLKRIHYAWIEQILSFNTAEERAEYIEIQARKADRKNQPEIRLKDQWFSLNDKRYYLRIRKPYNNNPIPDN